VQSVGEEKIYDKLCEHCSTYFEFEFVVTPSHLLPTCNHICVPNSTIIIKKNEAWDDAYQVFTYDHMNKTVDSVKIAMFRKALSKEDSEGNVALHILTEKSYRYGQQTETRNANHECVAVDTIRYYPEALSSLNCFGETPLDVALRIKNCCPSIIAVLSLTPAEVRATPYLDLLKQYSQRIYEFRLYAC